MSIHKIVILLFFIGLSSCDDNRVFDQYKTLSEGVWRAEEKLTFNFNIKDTISKRNLFLNIRNNNDYPFSNIFLITKIEFPNKFQIIDTLEYDMTDRRGKFLGKGITELKENKLFYKEHIVFPVQGSYVFKVHQAMRKSGEVEGLKALEGITEVGFRIEKTN